MGCCAEKLKIERLKEISHASVLASQIAGRLKMKMAVVKKVHHQYGEYYEGMDYDQAKSDGYKILRKYEPGKSMAV